jgi:predicted amidophosphoribosyltransferase
MANCGNGRCPYCGSCLVVKEWRLVCPRCGYEFGGEAIYEYITGRPSTYVRAELLSRRRWAGVMGVKIRGITELRQWIASKTNSQKGARDMTNYAERLARALIETGYFSEDEARALAGAFVRHYRALRYGDGLPKVDTVIEVLDSITSGRSNEEGGNYNMAIASALRRAFTTTGTYKPLIRRALREFTPDLEDGLVELATKIFRVIYSVIGRYTRVARRRYLPTVALLASAMAVTMWLGLPLNEGAVAAVLRNSGKEQVLRRVDVVKLVEEVRKVFQ